MDKVVCRVNPSDRSVTVFRDTDEGRVEEIYRSVSGLNAEFGNGLIRMDFVEGWRYSPFTRQPPQFRRAYFNSRRYSRYVDRETYKPVTDARAVVIDGSSVYYFGDK